jgi:hypothetical protein
MRSISNVPWPNRYDVERHRLSSWRHCLRGFSAQHEHGIARQTLCFGIYNQHGVYAMVGTCRLCRRNRALQISHLMPAAGKQLRDPALPNPNSVVVNREVALQSSWQAQDCLQCYECEQLFRKNGKDWILLLLAESRIPIALDTHDANPRSVTPKMKICSAGRLPEIDVEKVTYFAASIFWRACSHQWRSGKNKFESAGKLGPYEEEFRSRTLVSCEVAKCVYHRTVKYKERNFSA